MGEVIGYWILLFCLVVLRPIFGYAVSRFFMWVTLIALFIILPTWALPILLGAIIFLGYPKHKN
jgi:hypothetical protein